MAKRDLSGINTEPVYGAIREATGAEPDATPRKPKPRRSYSAEEAAEMLESMESCGHKGVRMPRINMAFTPSNYEYIKTMAQVRGQTLTVFVNRVIQKSMEDNMDIYEKAMEFRRSI